MIRPSELRWWLRPTRIPGVLVARLEARMWRRYHRPLNTRAEISGGQYDGDEFDEIYCQRCARLIPVSECTVLPFVECTAFEGHFHAPHGGRGPAGTRHRRTDGGAAY